MANELNKFLKKRKITVKELSEAEIIQTRKGEFVTHAYLNQLMVNESAGISLENINRIDKVYKLSIEERHNLLLMIKKGDGKVELSIEQKEDKKRERELFESVNRHKKILDECTEAEGLVQQLRKKAEAFKLLLCVDWKNHPDVKDRATTKAFQLIIENFLDNRVEAAEIQVKLLHILEKFQSIVTEGLNEENLIFLKLPSAFDLFDPQNIEKETKRVYEQGRNLVFSFIEKDVKAMKDDFMQWIQIESKKNSGLIDINDYVPTHKLFDLDSLFSLIQFPDMAYSKVSFFMLPPAAMLDLYCIADVIIAVKQFALEKINEKKAQLV